MTSEYSKRDFFNVLFDPGEKINFTNKVKGGIVLKPREFGYVSKMVFFCINPSKGNRKTEDISAFRNFLFEFDQEKDRAKQIKAIKLSQIPFSTLVWSGGKSHHAIISLDEPLPDKETYREYWRAIEECLKKYDIFPDAACKDPTRLSRTPGANRIENGEEQTLLKVKPRISRKQLDEYLAEHGVSHQKFKMKPPIHVDFESSADDDYKWGVNKKALRKQFGEFSDGNRHNYRLKAYYNCKRMGFSWQLAASYVDSEFWLDNDPQSADCYRNNVSVEPWIVTANKKEQEEYEKKVIEKMIVSNLSPETKKTLGL